MQSLKIISILLDYPREEVAYAATDLRWAVNESKELSFNAKLKLCDLIDNIYGGDLMDAQEEYVGLFDRGRALSLLLFEHVHGESRDRGQAMVDLMAVYQQHGFELNARELPDYIPLYLEYLAQRTDDEVIEGLVDVSHILAMLSARLYERGSEYHVLFDILLELAHVDVDIDSLREKAAEEERDDSLEALDKIWEEEAVRFDGSDVGSCTGSQNNAMGMGSDKTAPIHFVKEMGAASTTQQHK